MVFATTHKSGAKLVIFIIMAKFYRALFAVIFKKLLKISALYLLSTFF